jgi:hypothetical protein
MKEEVVAIEHSSDVPTNGQSSMVNLSRSMVNVQW